MPASKPERRPRATKASTAATEAIPPQRVPPDGPTPPDAPIKPTGPVFFLSYARAKDHPTRRHSRRDPNEAFKQLHADLIDRVSQLVATPAGHDVGFMDVEIEPGNVWRPELLWNVANCRVFVALLSAPYLNSSQWCAMEWDLFSRRAVAEMESSNPAKKPTAIIPVVWAPVEGPVPSIVSSVQRFSPMDVAEECATIYQRHGVMGAYYIDRDLYDAIVFTIARRIQIMVATTRVEPYPDPYPTDLRRSFADGGS